MFRAVLKPRAVPESSRVCSPAQGHCFVFLQLGVSGRFADDTWRKSLQLDTTFFLKALPLS